MDGMSPVPIEDSPVDRKAGMSPSRERLWGLVGGIVGPVVGVGAGVIAIAVDGIPWYTSGLYPLIFTEQRLLALDAYMILVFLVGVGFATAGAVYSRKSLYPRSDGFGAALLGTILMGVSGLVFFVRLLALIRA